jgi:DNA repair protein RadC
MPRERALACGVSTLSDVELLALLLGTGTQGLPVLDWAQLLIGQFGGLRGLLAAPAEALLRVPGLGPARSSRLQACLELARRASEQELQTGPCFDNPEAVRRYLRLHLARYDIEVCLALFLDTRHHLRAVVELSQGTLNQATVYPREVVRAALRVGAGAVILAHNHPSGDAEPSAADEQLTRTLKSALALVDVRVLDHVVVAGPRSVSLAERGVI